MAETFPGRAQAAQPALIEGDAGLTWAPGGRPKVVFAFTVAEGKVVAIDMIGDTEHLAELDIELVG